MILNPFYIAVQNVWPPKKFYPTFKDLYPVLKEASGALMLSHFGWAKCKNQNYYLLGSKHLKLPLFSHLTAEDQSPVNIEMFKHVDNVY